MTQHQFDEDLCADDVHTMFNLSYASYLVWPRSVMQSMPAEWQHQFAELADQLEDRYGGYETNYTVQARDNKGRFIHDELQNYQRGRRYVEPRPYNWGLSSNDLAPQQRED